MTTTTITTSVRNDTGAWECIDIEPGTLEDFETASISADDIGGEPGQDVLLRLVEDDVELTQREITAS